MHSMISRFAERCVEKQIISRDQVAWFIYGLEKRLFTIVASVPFLLLAIAITGFPCAVCFFAAFFFLRKYIGGFHANSALGCLIFSLLSELVLFFLLYPVLNAIAVLCIVVTGIVLTYILAPYNHPNMHLTEEEFAACRKKSRSHIWAISALVLAAGICGLEEAAKGLTLGIALATALLCLGHIFNRRISK